MIIRAEGMRDKLSSLFSKFTWLPTDKEFLTIEPEEVQELIKKHKDPLNRYLPYLWECEEISMAFVVDVRRERRNNINNISIEERRNYAIGEALGDKFNKIKRYHQLNLFFSQDYIYFLDIQTSQIWKATKNDNVFFVRF